MANVKDKILDAVETSEQRHLLADNLKERVYSTITLLAIMTVLWQNTTSSALSVIATMFISVLALWLATLVSARVSYRAVFGKSIQWDHYVKYFYTASGLFTPLIAPTIIIAISGMTGIYSLNSALVMSMIVSLLFLFGMSYIAGQKIYASFWRRIGVSMIEMSVGALVIILKILSGK